MLRLNQHFGICLIPVLLKGVWGGEECDTVHGRLYCAWGCCHLECCEHEDETVLGVAIGGVVVLVAILVALCIWKRRYMMKQAQLIRQMRYRALGTPILTPVGTPAAPPQGARPTLSAAHSVSSINTTPSGQATPKSMRVTPIAYPLQEGGHKHMDPPPEYNP